MLKLYIKQSSSQEARLVKGVIQFKQKKISQTKYIDISQKSNSIFIDLISSQSEKDNFLLSINNTTPYTSGDINLLGSNCTSIVDRDQEDFAAYKDEFEGADILIYDGCKSCNDCQEYWKIHNMLQEALLWTVGLKDNALYTQKVSSRLWNDNIANRVQGYQTVQPNNCPIQLQSPYVRSQQFGMQANKLLYQYKAAVGLWNYLVTRHSKQLIIKEAIEQPTGFSIISQLAYNACNITDSSNIKATLQISIRLIKGQVQEFNTGKLKFFVDTVPQNTRILYSSVKPLSYQDIQSTGTLTPIKDQTTLKFNIDYSPQIKCNLRFLAQIRVLPIVIASSNADSKIIDKQTYIKHKQLQVDTPKASYTQGNKNTWKVTAKWLINNQYNSLLQETSYYQTFY